VVLWYGYIKSGLSSKYMGKPKSYKWGYGDSLKKMKNTTLKNPSAVVHGNTSSLLTDASHPTD
jgi:hypothetical protein